MTLTMGTGSYSYGPPVVVGDGTVTVGKYCSLAMNVRLVTWGHHVDWFTTYPFQAKGWPKVKGHPVRKGGIRIGNDVWVGDSAMFMDGVTVGDGAVISAGSVVVSDVKPYSVVGGNPAQFLFCRFDKDVVRLLLKLAWWDHPEENIRRMMPVLCSGNVQNLEALCREWREWS